MTKTAPYGTWPSPLTAAQVAAADGAPTWPDVVGEEVWWTEPRPEQGGRITLLRAVPGEPAREVLAEPWNVRNRVHEYGGRPWTVLHTEHGRRLAFTNWDDQRIYLCDPDDPAEPVALSPEPERHHGVRYADLRPGPGGELWCVRERVTGSARTDVVRDLVALPVAGPERVLTSAQHFMTSPQPSPDGRHAAWFGWDHPRMPWDGTELCLAEIQPDGTFGPHRVLAGGTEVSVCQLAWESAESLLAVLDPDGWWNLYRIDLTGTVDNLAPGAHELGDALWKLGSRWFAPLGGGKHAVLRSGRLAVLDEGTRTVSDVPGTGGLPVWTASIVADRGAIVGVAGGPDRETAVVRLDLDSATTTEITSAAPSVPVDHLPTPVARTFTAADGSRIPAYYYPPTNPACAAPDGTAPPLLVHVHGGPTNRCSPALDLEFTYFTSRGFAVVAVNYGGSTGYGRAYRERLREQWGLVDVADCAAVAEALAAEGLADPKQLAIRGGSAGGWTAAAALTSVRTFRCGTVQYPILDLTAWTSDGGETHDFESRYLDSIVGALPEHAERYRERSPINRIDQLAGPVLLLQGLEDEICPPEQATRFIEALAGRGIPHAYLTFAGEQHGFRRAETIIEALQAELSFYGQVFGFEVAGVPALRMSE
ncbi:dipeptidyl aminopeptidase/acylaminoacyl peptidase [Tamaricihabitans halophyticus]|uniref:Dipeptidyl aminopeptidase/acylaminoacyl peptidase n=1 Tax=Tamaricihabitans halophyticus TaxID=1262583 RepID=A0A4R2QPW2_9PSEU|nr:prolyl oligopeptidase family serine peptidase [Tamaricihabitans halophyticus]TCP50969.1 dipeptidyl aminopeptidase/acylaminoacyl peptidase [Tamaricihabitans halophyticus]